MKKFYVWGTGPAQSTLIREAEASQEAVDAALAHGFVFASPDDWAVEVVTTEENIDALTRSDDAVAGYVGADVCITQRVESPGTVNKITNEAELYEALDIIFRQAVIAGLPIEKITAAFYAYTSYF